MHRLTILLFVFLVACGAAPAAQSTPAPVIGEAVTSPAILTAPPEPTPEPTVAPTDVPPTEAPAVVVAPTEAVTYGSNQDVTVSTGQRK